MIQAGIPKGFKSKSEACVLVKAHLLGVAVGAVCVM